MLLEVYLTLLKVFLILFKQLPCAPLFQYHLIERPTFSKMEIFNIGGLGRGRIPFRPNFLYFHAVFRKIWPQYSNWRIPVWENLDPPLFKDGLLNSHIKQGKSFNIE